MEKVFAFLGISSESSQAALVGGIVAVFGAGITALVTIWIAARTWKENARLERERRDAEIAVEQKRRDADREERKSDLHRALRAEIFNVWQAQYSFGPLSKRLIGAKARFESALAVNENFTPFVASSIGTILGESLFQQLTLLDEIEIQSVVAFYRQVRVIEGFSSDLRSAEYAILSLGRKEIMLLDLLRMEDRLVLLAEECLKLLEPKLNIPVTQNYAARKSQIDENLFNSREQAHVPPVQERRPLDPSQGRLP